MLLLVLVFGLPLGRAADVPASATSLRAEIGQFAGSAAPHDVRAAWVRYAERTGDTLPVGAVLATLPTNELTDPERALLTYDRVRRAAWSDDADTVLTLTRPSAPVVVRAPTRQRATTLRAWLLRGDLLARGPEPNRAGTSYALVARTLDPWRSTQEERDAARELRSQAFAGVARLHAARGRPDFAETYARLIDEDSDAFPEALALRAAAELADGVLGEGLGRMLSLDGPLAGRWFAPTTEVWAAAGAANGCDAATARDRLARYHAHAAALRATLDPGSPLFARLADGQLQPTDPELAPWAARDAELASLVGTIALLRAEGSPALAADVDAYTQGARRRLSDQRPGVEAALAAADTFAAQVEAAIGARTDADRAVLRVVEKHRPTLPFNGEFWSGELEDYQVWYPRRCDVVPTGTRPVEYG